MFAVIKDREKCVQELIALGADESIRDSVSSSLPFELAPLPHCCYPHSLPCSVFLCFSL
jgi:hypothetical protein